MNTYGIRAIYTFELARWFRTGSLTSVWPFSSFRPLVLYRMYSTE